MNEILVLTQKNKINSVQFKFGQIWTLCQKNVRLYFRKGPVVIFGLLFPFFMALTWVIGRNISNDRLFIGITAMAIFFTSTAVSPVILPWEARETGLERQISSPLTLKLILWGIIFASTIYSLIITAIVITLLGIGLGIAFMTPMAFMGFIIGLLLISCGGSLIGVLISAPATDQVSEIMTIANLVKFPLMFISGVFFPLSQLTGIAQIIAWFSPLTPFVDAISSCVGEVAILPLPINLVILFGWIIILYAVSWFAHSRTFLKRFSK
jgi:ABC-2 type transport system permease protein